MLRFAAIRKRGLRQPHLNPKKSPRREKRSSWLPAHCTENTDRGNPLTGTGHEQTRKLQT